MGAGKNTLRHAVRGYRADLIKKMLYGIQSSESSTAGKIIALVVTATSHLADSYAGTGFGAGIASRAGEHKTSPI